jgi:excisionase family DNA binding protein
VTGQTVGLVEPFHTVADMVKQLGLSHATVCRRIENGQFPGAYKDGQKWRIPESARVFYLRSIGALPSEDVTAKP